MKRCLLILIGLCTAAPVSAEIYRWTDENGRVHYGERPPQEAAEKIELRGGTSRPAGPIPDEAERRARQQRLLDAYSYEREQKKAQKAREQERRQRQSKACERIRKRWGELSFAGPIYYREPGGGRRYLNDDERTAELDKLRPSYRRACNEEPG